MEWWLGIAAVVAGALGYGYWEHTRESRRLTAIFARLSDQLGGRVVRASLLTLPQLHVDQDGAKLMVTAMPTSGQVAAGTTGYTGPFTFADLTLPHDSAMNLQILRIHGIVDEITKTLSLRGCTTGDAAFDAAFRLLSDDCSSAKKCVGADIRHRLVESSLEGLDIRINGRKISVHMNGFVQTQGEIEELIGIATRLAGRR